MAAGESVNGSGVVAAMRFFGSRPLAGEPGELAVPVTGAPRIGEFRKEWAELSEEDKAQIRSGLAETPVPSYTY